MNSFSAATAISEDHLNGFADAMKSIYAGNYGEDMADIGAAMAVVAQNARDLDPANIERMTTDALRLRDTFDFDVAESVRTANMLVDQFGMSGEEAFNLIAQGAQNGLNKNDDLLDTINEYSVHFKQLGFDAEDMFNSLASGAETGTFSVDKLGDAVKEFGIRVKDGTADDAFKTLGLNADATKKAFVTGGDAAAEAFQKVNEKLFQMDDKVKQNQLGVELYGTMWEDLGAEGVQALTQLNDQFDRTHASMNELDAVKYDDLGSVLGELGRTMQTDVLLPLGQELVPLLRDLVKRIKEVDFAAIGQQIADAFSWLVEHGTQIVSIVAGIAAAFGVIKLAPLVIAVQGVIGAIASGIPILTALGTALAPIGGWVTLVIAAVAALAAGLITLWNTNDGFREGVIRAWTVIRKTAAEVWGSICAFFTETIPNAWNSAIAFFQAAPAALGAVWESIKAFFVSGWNAIVQFFTTSVPAWIASMAAWFEQLPYKIGYALGTALVKVKEWGTNVKTFVTQTIPQVVENISTWFSQLPGRIGTFLTEAVQKVAAWGSQTAASAGAAASDTIQTVADWFSRLPGRIWTFLTEAVQKLLAWGTEMVRTAAAKMGEVVTTVTTTLKELPGRVASVGADIVRGIWNGITDMAGWIKNKIAGWCGDFVQGFQDALGIHSPSTEFRDKVGKHIPTGIAKGVEKTEKVAIQTVQELSKYLLDEAVSWVDDKKFYNPLTLQEELDFWQDLRRLTEFQADELHEIDKKIYSAKQSLLEEQQAAEQKLQKEQEQALAEYEQNLNSRADALRGFAGVFDEVTRDSEVTGTDLLKRLKGQVEAFESWQEGLAALEARGVGADLLEELREQGPKAVDEITALTKLSDAELAEYGTLYARKTMLALEQAQAELDGLNVPLTIGGGEAGIAQTVAQTLGVIGGMLTGGIAEQAVQLAGLAQQAVAGLGNQIPETVSNLDAAARYAVTPTAQSSGGDAGDWREVFAKALGDALVEGMTLIGDAIFDAIPKQVDLYLDSTRMARASWDAYNDEGSRRRRYFAPSREDIVRIAMSVMPKTL
ncbi:MAG: phage tail tape measure protein [Butyricicoccus sp.]